MVVGYGADKDQLNQKAGSLAVQVRDILDEVRKFQEFLAAKSNQELMDPPYSYTSEEVTLLKSAFTQLDQGRLVLLGQATVNPANNFLFFSAKLTGIN